MLFASNRRGTRGQPNRKWKRAVKKWVGKKKGGNAEAPDSPLKTLAEQMKKSAKGSSKKRKGEEIDDDVFDHHVLGCAAEVERLWSIARYVLTSQRSKMSPIPIMFETILFLKFNRELWDEKSLQKAWDRYRKEEAEERQNKRFKKSEEQLKELMKEGEDEEVLVDSVGGNRR